MGQAQHVRALIFDNRLTALGDEPRIRRHEIVAALLRVFALDNPKPDSCDRLGREINFGYSGGLARVASVLGVSAFKRLRCWTRIAIATDMQLAAKAVAGTTGSDALARRKMGLYPDVSTAER